MKRRLTSAALALIMAATAVTAASCGQEDNLDSVGEDKIANATTLNIWGIKGEGTTDEAIAAVEEAMSEITQAQFNTADRAELQPRRESERGNAAEQVKRMRSSWSRGRAGEGEGPGSQGSEKKEPGGGDHHRAVRQQPMINETILDEYGLPETFYPDVEEHSARYLPHYRL